MNGADPARRAAEQAARTSYGRLVALLAARTGDIAGAEDALAEAFAAALRHWPERGVPRNPDAWLFTAARRTLMNEGRHRGVRDDAVADLLLRIKEDAASAREPGVPDERLKLLFVCAHPAIDAAIRTPLMLQTVLGLDAGRIGAAFLIAPATMGQRLVRAKAKVRDAGIRFAVPEPEELAPRLADVLDAVYAAFGAGWDALDPFDAAAHGLADEAIYRGRLLVALLPEEPAAKGLLALMLHCEARRAARRDAQGRFVALERQDAALWSRDLIVEAEALIVAAARTGRFGRYQCEAAIQSVHAQRPLIGRTDHAALLTLYDLLLARAPSAGAAVSRAAVILGSGRPDAALTSLDATAEAFRVDAHQPYWAARAHALAALDRRDEAADAFRRAAGLSTDPAVRAHLLSQVPVGAPGSTAARPA